MNNYFQYDEKMVKFFQTHRGFLISINIDKISGEDRTLTGILCLSKKNVPMISEGEDVNNPQLKQIPVTRIKSIFIDGHRHYPKKDGTNV